MLCGGQKSYLTKSGMYAGLFTHMDADADKYGAKARKQINKDLYGKMGTEDERLMLVEPERCQQ